jgi:Ca2+-binding EF-hand superfamily protein
MALCTRNGCGKLYPLCPDKFCPDCGNKNPLWFKKCTGGSCDEIVAVNDKFCPDCGTKNSNFTLEQPKQHLYEGMRLHADYTDEKWIKRHRHMYDKLDRDSNGYVTFDEFIYKASVEICGAIGATPAQTERHTKAVTNFFIGAGMQFGVEQLWSDYIKGWEPLIETELDKWEKKEPTLIREWGEALFDIIDKNGNGFISLNEWETYQRAAKVCDTVKDCANTFAVCDRNGDGKIEIDEMIRQHVGFWYTADPSSDGLYGPGVP